MVKITIESDGKVVQQTEGEAIAFTVMHEKHSENGIIGTTSVLKAAEIIRGLKSLQAELMKKYGDKGLKELVALMIFLELGKKDDADESEVSMPDGDGVLN